MHGNMEFQKIVKTKAYKAAKDATMDKQAKSYKGKAKQNTWQRTDKRNFEVM